MLSNSFFSQNKPMTKDFHLDVNGESKTTPKRGGLMNPLKGGRFDIHFHRRDAEHAEDLFNFLLSAETRLTRLSESDGGQGAES
ncbi:MAG: hypothetical protein ABF291_18055 [Desulfobacterales bacterium]